MRFPLTDSRILVTGAGSGIGRAVALRCAADGAQIIACDIDAASVQMTSDTIRAAGRQASAHLLDVSDAAAVDALLRAPERSFGPVDALIHAAGILGDGTATTTTLDAWNRVLTVNLTGTWLMSRAVLPEMVDRGRGAIVCVASVAGLVGTPGNAAYSASKGGILALTRQMATDFAPANVRVNAICPGSILTPMLVERYRESGLFDGRTEAEGLDQVARRYPLRRLGSVEEVAGMAAFLVGPDAGFMTGMALPIDGGITANGWQVGA